MGDNVSPWCAINNGADQPAHLGRLVSASSVLFLESITSERATGEISILGEWFQCHFVRNHEDIFCRVKAKLMPFKLCIKLLGLFSIELI